MTTRTVPVLDRRTLNRITLERQLLLRRSSFSAADAIEHLVGMQAQYPNAPYVGLWSRLRHFKHDDLAQLLLQKKAGRIALMRSTIHLATARDCMGLRPLVQPALDRDLFKNFTYGPDVAGLPMEEAVAYGRKLLDEQPLTAEQLGEQMRQKWPDRPAASLAYAMRNLLPLIQIPPRGIWGVGGQTRYAVASTWFGRTPDQPVTHEDIVLRYLGAFGPASTQDMQTWSGLTKLQPAVDRLATRLRTVRDENGKLLYDLAEESEYPAAELPAPPRFLPEFDNVLFAYANRTRMISDEHRKRLIKGNRAITAVLLDGFVCGAWKVERHRQTAVLTIETFEPLTQAGKDELTDEGANLLRFVAEGADHDIRFAATL